MKYNYRILILFLVFMCIFIACILLDYTYEVCLPVGIGLFVWAVVQIYDFKRMLRNSRTVTAEVASYKTRMDRSRIPFFTKKQTQLMEYAPIMRYCTSDGMEVEAEYPYYSGDKQYLEGECVSICYFIEKPGTFWFPHREKEYLLNYWNDLVMSAILMIVCMCGVLGKYWN